MAIINNTLKFLGKEFLTKPNDWYYVNFNPFLNDLNFTSVSSAAKIYLYSLDSFNEPTLENFADVLDITDLNTYRKVSGVGSPFSTSCNITLNYDSNTSNRYISGIDNINISGLDDNAMAVYSSYFVIIEIPIVGIKASYGDIPSSVLNQFVMIPSSLCGNVSTNLGLTDAQIATINSTKDFVIEFTPKILGNEILISNDENLKADPYLDQVLLFLNNKTFYNKALRNNCGMFVTQSGVTIDATNTHLDNPSYSFSDASNSVMTVTGRLEWNKFGLDDFTIEFSARVPNINLTTGAPLIDNRPNTSWTNHFFIGLNASGQVYVKLNNTLTITGTSNQVDKWFDVALVRNSGVFTLYVNGAKEASYSGGVTIDYNTAVMYFGRDTIVTKANGGYLTGYMNNIRITRYARYLSSEDSIDVPTSAFIYDYYSTLDKVDILNDGSGLALYRLNYDAKDSGGLYDASATSVTYSTETDPMALMYKPMFEQFAQVSTSSILNFTSLANYFGTNQNLPFSMSCWIRRVSTTDTFFYFGDNNNGVNGINITPGGNIKGKRTSITTDNFMDNDKSYADMDYIKYNNVFYHFVVTYDGNKVETFINGNLVQSVECTLYCNGTLKIANMNGRIEQVRFFKRKLYPNEFENLRSETLYYDKNIDATLVNIHYDDNLSSSKVHSAYDATIVTTGTVEPSYVGPEIYNMVWGRRVSNGNWSTSRPVKDGRPILDNASGNLNYNWDGKYITFTGALGRASFLIPSTGGTASGIYLEMNVLLGKASDIGITICQTVPTTNGSNWTTGQTETTFYSFPTSGHYRIWIDRGQTSSGKGRLFVNDTMVGEIAISLYNDTYFNVCDGSSSGSGRAEMIFTGDRQLFLPNENVKNVTGTYYQLFGGVERPMPIPRKEYFPSLYFRTGTPVNAKYTFQSAIAFNGFSLLFSLDTLPTGFTMATSIPLYSAEGNPNATTSLFYVGIINDGILIRIGTTDYIFKCGIKRFEWYKLSLYSNTNSLYLNGSLIGTIPYSSNSSTTVYIGNSTSSGNQFNGYISNLLFTTNDGYDACPYPHNSLTFETGQQYRALSIKPQIFDKSKNYTVSVAGALEFGTSRINGKKPLRFRNTANYLVLNEPAALATSSISTGMDFTIEGIFNFTKLSKFNILASPNIYVDLTGVYIGSVSDKVSFAFNLNQNYHIRIVNKTVPEVESQSNFYVYIDGTLIDFKVLTSSQTGKLASTTQLLYCSSSTLDDVLVRNFRIVMDAIELFSPTNYNFEPNTIINYSSKYISTTKTLDILQDSSCRSLYANKSYLGDIDLFDAGGIHGYYNRNKFGKAQQAALADATTTTQWKYLVSRNYDKNFTVSGWFTGYSTWGGAYNICSYGNASIYLNYNGTIVYNIASSIGTLNTLPILISGLNHIVYVNKNDYHTVYINGVAINIGYITTTIADTDKIFIGGSPIKSNTILNSYPLGQGSFNQVRVFDRALNAAEIDAVRNEKIFINSSKIKDIFQDGSCLALYPLETNINEIDDTAATYDFGLDDFTFETWIYFNSISNDPIVFATDGTTATSLLIGITGSTGLLKLVINGAIIGTGNTVLTVGTWYNIAVTRINGSFKIFVNGVLDGTVYSTVSLTGAAPVIGNGSASTTFFNGYICNLRLSKGIARYNANYSPSVSELPSDNYTLLYLKGDSTSYAETYTTKVLSNQSNKVTENGSLYFKNNSLMTTSLSDFAFGTGDFTFEGWINVESITSGNYIFSVGKYGNNAYIKLSIEATGLLNISLNTGTWAFAVNCSADASNAITANSWNHIGVQRKSGEIQIFANGYLVKTLTDSTNINPSIGRAFVGGYMGNRVYPFNGFLNDFRVSKISRFQKVLPPSQVKTSNTLLHISGALADTSNAGKGVVVNGTVPLNNSIVKNNANSIYFDGVAANYLSMAPSEDFNFGSADFTVECWLYIPSRKSASSSIFMSDGSNSSGLTFGFNGSGKLGTYHAGVQRLTSVGTLPLTTWTHVAMVRASGTIKFFINGVLDSSVAYAGTYTYTRPRVGTNPDTTLENALCYLDDLRVSKVARYSSTFTPNTTPLTSDASTVFLLSGSLKDIGNKTLVNNNAVVSSTVSKFNANAIAFNGVNNYIDVTSTDFAFGTSDFTIELWAYPTISGTLSLLSTMSTANSVGFNFETGQAALGYSSRNDGSITSYNTTLTLNTWSHMAFVREGTLIRVYINGVLAGSGTTAATTSLGNQQLRIGCRYINNTTYALFGGYMDDIQVSKVAKYSANFIPNTSAFTNDENTILLLNAPTTIGSLQDANITSRTVTPVGNTTVSSGIIKHNATSLYFDGSGDRIDVSSYNSDLLFNTSDFTVEFWVNPAAIGTDQYFFDAALGINQFCVEYYQGRLIVNINGGTVLNPLASIVAKNWYHIAVVRSSGSLSLFLNGSCLGTATYSNNINQLVNGIRIGTNGAGSVSGDFYGYMDEFRISKVARYSATTNYSFSPSISRSFTPSTSAVGTDTNTVLYLKGDTLTDASGTNKVLTLTGNNIVDDSVAPRPLLGDYTITDTSSTYDVFSDSSCKIAYNFENSNANNMDTTTGTSTVVADSYTKLLINGAIADSSGTSKVITASGNAVLSTTQVKNNAKSIYFDGTLDYLSTPSTSDFAFGTGDFTVEFWMYGTSINATTGQTIITVGTTGSDTCWLVAVKSNNLYFQYNTSAGWSWASIVTAPVSINTNAWYHIVAQRVSGVIQFFVNGVKVYEVANTGSIRATGTVYVGSYYTAGGGDFAGYLDSIRVSKGIARYSANFIPNGLSYNGTPTGITYGVGKFGTKCATFNGSGTISLPNIVTFPFTLSCFIKKTDMASIASGAQHILATNILGVRFSIYFSTYAGGNIIIASGGSAHYTATIPVTSNWFHIAVVCTAVNSYSLYIDDVSYPLTNFGGAMGGSNTGTNIGSNGASTEYFTSATSIDQVRIFNRALNYKEINALYTETKYVMTNPNHAWTIGNKIISFDGSYDSSCLFPPITKWNGAPTGTIAYGTSGLTLNGSSYISFKGLANSLNEDTDISCSLWLSDTAYSGVILSFGMSGKGFNLADNLTLNSSNQTNTVASALSVKLMHHVTITYSKVNSTFKLYTDGSLIATQTSANWNDYNVLKRIIIGTIATGLSTFGTYSSFALRQFRVFNKTLSDLEVTKLYNELSLFTEVPISKENQLLLTTNTKMTNDIFNDSSCLFRFESLLSTLSLNSSNNSIISSLTGSTTVIQTTKERFKNYYWFSPKVATNNAMSITVSNMMSISFYLTISGISEGSIFRYRQNGRKVMLSVGEAGYIRVQNFATTTSYNKIAFNWVKGRQYHIVMNFGENNGGIYIDGQWYSSTTTAVDAQNQTYFTDGLMTFRGAEQTALTTEFRVTQIRGFNRILSRKEIDILYREAKPILATTITANPVIKSEASKFKFKKVSTKFSNVYKSKLLRRYVDEINSKILQTQTKTLTHMGYPIVFRDTINNLDVTLKSNINPVAISHRERVFLMWLETLTNTTGLTKFNSYLKLGGILNTSGKQDLVIPEIIFDIITDRNMRDISIKVFKEYYVTYPLTASLVTELTNFGLTQNDFVIEDIMYTFSKNIVSYDTRTPLTYGASGSTMPDISKISFGTKPLKVNFIFIPQRHSMKDYLLTPPSLMSYFDKPGSCKYTAKAGFNSSTINALIDKVNLLTNFDYFISVDGSDDNSGTSIFSPKKTLTGIASGKNVLLLPGTYNEIATNSSLYWPKVLTGANNQNVYGCGDTTIIDNSAKTGLHHIIMRESVVVCKDPVKLNNMKVKYNGNFSDSGSWDMVSKLYWKYNPADGTYTLLVEDIDLDGYVYFNSISRADCTFTNVHFECIGTYHVSCYSTNYLNNCTFTGGTQTQQVNDAWFDYRKPWPFPANGMTNDQAGMYAVSNNITNASYSNGIVYTGSTTNTLNNVISGFDPSVVSTLTSNLLTNVTFTPMWSAIPVSDDSESQYNSIALETNENITNITNLSYKM